MVQASFSVDAQAVRNRKSACRWTSWRNIDWPEKASLLPNQFGPLKRLQRPKPACPECLAFGCATSHLFHFALLSAARIFPRFLGSLFFAGRSLYFLPFFLAQFFGIWHGSSVIVFSS